MLFNFQRTTNSKKLRISNFKSPSSQATIRGLSFFDFLDFQNRHQPVLVGLRRLELLTPRLSSVCSNQLSYRPSGLHSLKTKQLARVAFASPFFIALGYDLKKSSVGDLPSLFSFGRLKPTIRTP
jgi:hypothetical protein